MTLQASKDENSSRKLFLTLFPFSEYQASCLSPGRSHMQIHNSVKLGLSWFSKQESSIPLFFLLPSRHACCIWNRGILWTMIAFSQTCHVLSCRLTWIETKQAPRIHLYSDPVKHSFKILSWVLFQRALTGCHKKGGSLNAIWEWAGRYTNLLEEFWQALRYRSNKTWLQLLVV